MIPDFSTDSLEDIRELERALKGSNFRFIVLQYNHRSIVSFLKDHFQKRFPNKNSTELDLGAVAPQSFLSNIKEAEAGIVFLNNFEKLLADPSFAVFFNQRRDLLSELPIQMIALLPSGPGFIRKVVEKIPDMWSLRNLTLSLEVETERNKDQLTNVPVGTLGGENLSEKNLEIAALKKRIRSLPKIEKNKDLLFGLLDQLQSLYEDIGEYKNGLETVDTWYHWHKELFGNDDNLLEIFDGKGKFQWYLGNYADALRLKEKALKLAEASKDEHKVSRLQSNLALVLQDLGDYAGAKALLEKALASAERNYGKDHPTIAIRYSNLALVLKALGDYAGARALLEKAMASAERNYGKEHPTTAVSYSNLALVLKDLGDYAGAKALLEKAVASAERNYGKEHPSTARSYSNLATVLQALGDYEDAIVYSQQSVTIFEATLPEGHPNIKKAKNILAGIQEAMKKKNL